MDKDNDITKTVVFEPLKEEEEKQKEQNIPNSQDFGKVYYYDKNTDEDDDEEDEDGKEDNRNSGNGVLIGLVIVLVILFIAAMIWGTVILNKINKEEEEEKGKEDSPEVVQEVIEEEEIPVEEPAETESEKINCEIFFKSSSIEEKGAGYTVRTIFTDKDGKYHTERVTIDENTEIRENGDKLSYRTFVAIIKALDDKEIEFDGVIDKETLHVDSVTYKKEILDFEEEEEEKEDEGTVLEESFEEEQTEENEEVSPE